MEDYIKYIRSLIGHKEVMAIGVATLVLNEKEEVLLETRSDNKMFSFPGGALNMGEKVKAGALRELKEETGITLKESDLKLIGIYSGQEGRMVYPNSDITFYTDIVFLTHVKESEIKLISTDGESLALNFVPFKDIDLSCCLKMDQKVLTNYFIKNIKDIVVD